MKLKVVDAEKCFDFLFTVVIFLSILMIGLIIRDSLNERSDRIEEDRENIKNIQKEVEQLQETKDELNERLDRIESFLEEWTIDEYEITAYAPLDPNAINGMCYEGNPNITSTGEQVSQKTIAVDPEKIPYGSDIIIIGEDFTHKGIAQDTGGAMRNEQVLDIVKDTREEAFNFGRQEAVVLWK